MPALLVRLFDLLLILEVNRLFIITSSRFHFISLFFHLLMYWMSHFLLLQRRGSDLPTARSLCIVLAHFLFRKLIWLRGVLRECLY